MNYWLIKSEPSTWSWDDQKKHQITSWDDVRNYQASNNLKAMKIGDLCLFYHSVSDKKIMGIVEVVKTYYPDPTDETNRFGMVDVKFVKDVQKPVSLETIKSDLRLVNLPLIRQFRLSVMPISQEAWEIILEHSL